MSNSTPKWPDDLQPPDPERIQHVLEAFWHHLRELPDLLARREHLLADACTVALRELVLEMMLALNGIQRPPDTRHLNTYLGDSQREAIEKTLVALSISGGTWSARAVALTVIYRWYAPQLVQEFDLVHPQALEEEVLAHLHAQSPDWPLRIDTA